MHDKKNIIPLMLIILSLCRVVFSQEDSNDKEKLNKTFIAKDQKVPEVIAFGLSWPTAKEIASKKITTGQKVKEKVRVGLSKCIKSSFYDSNAIEDLISLKDWTGPNSITRIKQFEKGGYIFHIYDNIGTLLIGIKKADGNDIWDMEKDHTKFLSEVIDKFFQKENIGPRKDKKTFYAKPEGTEGFYYCYSPIDGKDFWSAYMWTNGKIISLRVDKQPEHFKIGSP